MFNMEFFHDAASGKLTVIEFNPRMAAQFSDLYLRVEGIDLHRVSLELAHGRDPALLPRSDSTRASAGGLPALRPSLRPLGLERRHDRDARRLGEA